jgi:hypothetical protein
MFSNNLPSDIIEATTKKALEWSAEKVSNLVKSFRERKLAFIKEPKNNRSCKRTISFRRS